MKFEHFSVVNFSAQHKTLPRKQNAIGVRPTTPPVQKVRLNRDQ